MRIAVRRPSRDFVLLALLWLVIHSPVWFWLAEGRNYIWDIAQAKKLLDYGFWARKGAIMEHASYFGILPNPSDFNYVDHPYPIFWLHALLYKFFGSAGPYALVAFLGLVGCLLTYRFLKYFFPSNVAWFTAALFTVAHGTIEFIVNTDNTAQSAIVWPVTAVVIMRWKRAGYPAKTAMPWLLGLVVFACGQISWMAFSIVPALLLLALPEDMPLRIAIRRPWTVPGWMPVLIGSAASLALFIGQILIYSPNLYDSVGWIGYQASRESLVAARLKMMPVLLLRTLLPGPALWLGALVGLSQIPKIRANRRVTAIMLFYLGVFALVTLLIPGFFFFNQHAQRYVLFPCAVLTAFALSNLAAKWLRAGLVSIAFVGLVFCYARVHDYRVSMASITFGRWLGQNSRPDEIMFSNLRFRMPPIQPSDGEFFNDTCMVGDRYVGFGSTNQTTFVQTARPFKGHLKDASFLHEASQPIDPVFLAKIQSCSLGSSSTNLEVPPEGPLMFKEARKFLWLLLGRRAPYSPDAAGSAHHSNSFALTIYRLSPECVRELNELATAPEAPPLQSGAMSGGNTPQIPTSKAAAAD
jgi:hypothetical protein